MDRVFEWALVSIPSGGFFLGISPFVPVSRSTVTREILKNAGISLRPFFVKSFSPSVKAGLFGESSPEFLEFREHYLIPNTEELRRIFRLRWRAFEREETSLGFDEGPPWPLDFSSPSKEDFFDDFTQIQHQISAGLLKKAVPVTFEFARGVFKKDPAPSGDRNFEAWALHRLLRSFEDLKPEFQKKLNLYSLCYGETFLMGLSPEILLSNAISEDQKTFQTVALAGSAPLTVSDAEFLADPKERAEHDWVVQGIQACVDGLGGEIFPEPLRVETFPRLKHLKTPLSWKVKEDFDPFLAVSQLHPTPALGVQPRSREALQFFKDLRCSKIRGNLGSPLSVWDGKGLFHSLVAIRGIDRRGSDLALGAGCGIVEASQFEKEWQECSLKRQSIKALFGWI